MSSRRLLADSVQTRKGITYSTGRRRSDPGPKLLQPIDASRDDVEDDVYTFSVEDDDEPWWKNAGKSSERKSPERTSSNKRKRKISVPSNYKERVETESLSTSMVSKKGERRKFKPLFRRSKEEKSFDDVVEEAVVKKQPLDLNLDSDKRSSSRYAENVGLKVPVGMSFKPMRSGCSPDSD